MRSHAEGSAQTLSVPAALCAQPSQRLRGVWPSLGGGGLPGPAADPVLPLAWAILSGAPHQGDCQG
ncbi:MAG: hypothetical protein ABSA53_14330 [Streptosporangiaceae bacterium]